MNFQKDNANIIEVSVIAPIANGITGIILFQAISCFPKYETMRVIQNPNIRTQLLKVSIYI